MQRACPICAAPNCLTHNPNLKAKRTTHRSRGRDRWRQEKFRRAVLTRDNYTCQGDGCGHHDPTGRTLRACHTTPFARTGSYDPSQGVTLCKTCDMATDPYAR